MNKNSRQNVKIHNRKKQQKQRSSTAIHSDKTFEGKLEITKSGNGYVVIEGKEHDVFIDQKGLKMANHGDTVRIKITRISSSGKPDGEIVEVIKHTQDQFVGTLQINDRFGFVVIDNAKVNFDVFIPQNKLKKYEDGERVIVKIVEWNDKGKNPVGTIVSSLSTERDNQIAMKEILLNNGFRLHFNENAIKESKKLSGRITDSELAKRKDCRDILTFTIDPKDAKDFDDAISFKPLKDGYFEVGVHIADVSHFIQPGTALDEDAFENATSVYLPDRVLPMLPEHISNVLCSLRPNEEKYTFSAIFQINEKGHIKQHWIGRTVIESDRRFTYEEAQEIIEGAEGDHKQEILILNNIAKSLRAERFANGAINFNSTEIRYELNNEGVPIGIEIKESKEAHQLIEELMLLANRYVAQFVQKRMINGAPIPFPYRVHDQPDVNKIEQYAAFVAKFGYKLITDNPDMLAKTFNQMLNDIKGKPEEHLLSELGIRTMSKASYTTNNIGHYGLGFENYCHFTSPIRRYPDIMVHRIVQQCIDNKIVIDKKMEQKSEHCSERERKAMEAERSANKYKQVEYMQQFIGEELSAIVSGVNQHGFWAETVEQKCEGMISMHELIDIDNFQFIESEYAIVGKESGIKIRIGDPVIIQVLAANLENKLIDYGLVGIYHKGQMMVIERPDYEDFDEFDFREIPKKSNKPNKQSSIKSKSKSPKHVSKSNKGNNNGKKKNKK